MLWLAAGLAAAQTCPFRLQITRTDGSRDCFTNLPIARLVDPSRVTTLEALVSRAVKYQIAMSSADSCVAVGFGAVHNLTASGIEAFARNEALSVCQRQGCPCEIVVDDGRVVSTLAESPRAAGALVQGREPEQPRPQALPPRPLLSSPQVPAPQLPQAASQQVQQPAPPRPQAAPMPRASDALSPGAAQVPLAPQARRHALVVGNDSYQAVARLRNARADARAVAQILERFGFEVRLRLDLGERAFKDELRAFKSLLQGGEEAVFYFAGHGVQLRGVNYLLPVDIRGDSEDQVRDDAMPLQKVLDDLQERRSRFALAIVDACRDNPFTGSGRAIGSQGLAPSTPATGQMVIFSAGAGQRALDSLGQRDPSPNGVFTRVLLQEIDKPGITVDRVLRNIRSQVATLARTVGHDQVPALYDQSLGDFYLRR